MSFFLGVCVCAKLRSSLICNYLMARLLTLSESMVQVSGNSLVISLSLLSKSALSNHADCVLLLYLQYYIYMEHYFMYYNMYMEHHLQYYIYMEHCFKY